MAYFKFNDVITYLTEDYRFSKISIMLEYAQRVCDPSNSIEYISHKECAEFFTPQLMREMECDITSYVFHNQALIKKSENQLVTIG